MIIDIHAHLWYRNYERGKKDLLRAVKLYDIDRVYLSGLGCYYPDKDEVRELNAEVSNFIREQPEHFGGLVYVNPDHDNALEVLQRGIEEQGMSGMKLWVCTFCDDPHVYPLIEKTIEYGVPTLVHAFHKANGQVPNETIGENVANLARRYPEAKLLMAHFGGNCYNGIPAIRDCPNVWCDYCGSIFRGDELQYGIEQLGVDRILFGTDMAGSYLVNLGQVLELDLSQEDREKILSGNALKLLDRNFRL